MVKRAAGVAAAVVIMAWVSVASADLVRPPPKICAPGSRGVSSHAGPACVVADCRSDDNCKTGESCRDTALCIHVQEYSQRRRPEQILHRTVATGECASGPGACKAPASCSKARRCVAQATGTAATAPSPSGTGNGPAPSGTTGRPPKSGSRCSLGAAGPAEHEPTGAAAATLLGLLLVPLRRRRTRKAS